MYVEQLCPLEVPLRRIKLKVFGHAGAGKTRLICALQSGSMIGSLIGAVQRRFSDNPSPSSSTTSSPSQGSSFLNCLAGHFLSPFVLLFVLSCFSISKFGSLFRLLCEGRGAFVLNVMVGV